MSKLRNAIVILVVFFLLGTLLLCGLQAMREAATAHPVAWANTSSLGLSMHNFTRHKAASPAYFRSQRATGAQLARCCCNVSRVPLQQCRFNEPWDSPHNRTLASGPPHRHVGNLSRLPLWKRRRFRPA